MKKIPTLFVRTFDEHHRKSITREVTTGMDWVLAGDGIATVKIDGSCCAIIDREFYRRYDAKKGKVPPLGAIPCCEPDQVTGHWPHWVKISKDDPGDRWLLEAYKNSGAEHLCNGTYEAIGPHFQANPYDLDKDRLVKHGEIILDVPRSFDGLKDFLEVTPIEGIVFWKDGIPHCKLKRSDFGFKWPVLSAAEFVAITT